MVFVDSIIPTAHAAFDSAAFANVVNPVLNEIVYPIVYVVFALGVFIFAFGVFEMIIKGSAEARETGKRHILYGVIGMFIMLSAWGIIHFVSDTLFAIQGAAVGGGNSSIGIQPATNYQSVSGSSGTYSSVGGSSVNAGSSASGSNGSSGGTYSNTSQYSSGSGSGAAASSGVSGTNCPPGDYDPTCTSHTGSASSASSNSTSNNSASSANCPPGDYDPACASSNSSGNSSASSNSSGVVNLSSGRTYDPATNQWFINGTPEANPNSNNTSSGSGGANSSSGSSAGCDTDSQGNCL